MFRFYQKVNIEHWKLQAWQESTKRIQSCCVENRNRTEIIKKNYTLAALEGDTSGTALNP